MLEYIPTSFVVIRKAYTCSKYRIWAEEHIGTNGTLIMPDLYSVLRRPYNFLILGVTAVSAAVVFTCVGKGWVRFNGWVYRANEPGWFWWEVALDFLFGVCLIGYFLYKVHAP